MGQKKSSAMMTGIKKNKNFSGYEKFEAIDGSHPFKSLEIDGFVEYQVIELNKGKVLYFNFNLAKEMGLIEINHEHSINPVLESILIKTFSIQIINEFDILNKKRIPKKLIKTNKYMATRYLQLQHQNKKGVTSGDGRSIWNGFIENNGTIWDVSSRGTGVTILSPGSAKSKKPLQTGNKHTGYGCGQADVDELLSSAIMSENLHLKGYNTERVLCVIDLGNGAGIGVRAGLNLFRPAHILLYLKQERLKELRSLMNFVIDRQIQNKKLRVPKNIFPIQKFKLFLNQFIEDMARFVARCESEYLFVWMEWDGDNLLIDPGIIDYGSIRHFGVCHNQYRYDDVDRYSTNLTEQKAKAKIIIMEIAQAIDYLITGNKKSLTNFNSSTEIKRFEKRFAHYQLVFFAKKIGLDKKQILQCLTDKNISQKFLKLKATFTKIENLKTLKGKIKVPDGINSPPIFNMRKISRELHGFIFNLNQPNKTLNYNSDPNLSCEEFFLLFSTKYATSKDQKWVLKNKTLIALFLSQYKSLFEALNIFCSQYKINQFKKRVNTTQPENFLSGNGLIHSVDDMTHHHKQFGNKANLQLNIEKFVTLLSKGTYSDSLIDKNFLERSYLDKLLWNKLSMNLHEFNEEI